MLDLTSNTGRKSTDATRGQKNQRGRLSSLDGGMKIVKGATKLVSAPVRHAVKLVGPKKSSSKQQRRVGTLRQSELDFLDQLIVDASSKHEPRSCSNKQRRNMLASLDEAIKSSSNDDDNYFEFQ